MCVSTSPLLCSALANWIRSADIWAPSCAIAAVFIYFFLPEVKGRSLEEIDEMFMARLPARKFRKYVCTGQAAIEGKMRNARRSEDGGEDSKKETVETIEKVFGDKKAVADVVENALHVA